MLRCRPSHQQPVPRVPIPALARRLLPGSTLGMALGVLSYLCFALHDATIKLLVGGATPVWMVLFARSAAICAVCVAVGRGRLLRRAVATPIKPALFARGAINLAAWLCYYTAARDLPLAQLLTLYFAAPLVTTLLAAPMLGERVTRARWLSAGVGFVGVVVACDPGGVAVSRATLLVLLAAGLWGYAVILMRRTALQESNLLLMFYTNGVFLAATAGAGAAFGWTPPDGRALALLLAVGGIGTLAQLALFEGMRHAAASVMATVEYSALLWAFALGFLIWGDVPTLAVFLGAAMILLAGALLVVTERRAR